jgi:hypothetical protein
MHFLSIIREKSPRAASAGMHEIWHVLADCFGAAISAFIVGVYGAMVYQKVLIPSTHDVQRCLLYFQIVDE